MPRLQIHSKVPIALESVHPGGFAPQMGPLAKGLTMTDCTGEVLCALEVRGGSSTSLTVGKQS